MCWRAPRCAERFASLRPCTEAESAPGSALRPSGFDPAGDFSVVRAVDASRGRLGAHRHPLRDKRSSSPSLNHKRYHRGKRASNVQGLHPFDTVDLAAPCMAGHLTGSIEQHSCARRAHRVPTADQAPAHIHRTPSARLDGAFLDGQPTLPGRRQAQVIERDVFRSGETVVGLHATNILDASNTGALPSGFDGLPHMGKDIGLTAAAIKLVEQTDPRIPVPPARDARKLGAIQSVPITKASLTSTIEHAPSVTCPQSCRRVPGSMRGLASSSSVKLSSSNCQARVCANGLRRALL